MRLEDELKELIIKELKLEDISPEDVTDDSPLFGDDGLGLDSLDVVELVVILNKNYKLDLKNQEKAQKVLISIKTLADYIREKQESA